MRGEAPMSVREYISANAGGYFARYRLRDPAQLCYRSLLWRERD